MPLNFPKIAPTARQQCTNTCMTVASAMCNISDAAAFPRHLHDLLFMNKPHAYLVYFKWRNKLKHRDGSLFYCWQSVPIKLSQLMRKVGTEFVEREKVGRLSASPESVTMTDNRLRKRMTSSETSARLHRAWPRKSPTPTHASTPSTRPPTNSRAVSQNLARCLPRKPRERIAWVELTPNALGETGSSIGFETQLSSLYIALGQYE